MRSANFRFIDLPTSAERLDTTRNQLLQWVAEGRIKPFSGSGQQSVFRAADVDRLAAELGIGAAGEASAPPVEVAAEQEVAHEQAPKGRQKRRDPIKLIGTRLSMDSRWAEISDNDISTWLDALEPVQFERVRRVADLAVERLQRVLTMLGEQESKSLDLRGDK